MGFLSSNFIVEKYDLPPISAYSKIVHMELDIPTGYCRIDLAWYASKEAIAKGAGPLDIWSFTLDIKEINALLKNEGNESALELAYNTVRTKDERFEEVEDDK